MITLVKAFETDTLSRVVGCRVPPDVYQDLVAEYGTPSRGVRRLILEDLLRRHREHTARSGRGLTRLGRELRRQLTRALAAVERAEADGRIGGAREVSSIGVPLCESLLKLLQLEVLR